MSTVYVNLEDITKLQREVMLVIETHVKKEKTPVPLQSIVNKMKYRGTRLPATVSAVNSLLRKRYIRRAVTISNKTYFVQIKKL